MCITQALRSEAPDGVSETSADFMNGAIAGLNEVLGPDYEVVDHTDTCLVGTPPGST
jgi:hypothetical protein